MLVPIRKKFKYEHLKRLDTATRGRMYLLEDGGPLPSVTTILSAMKDRTHLDAWAEKIGHDEADRIRNEAATVGTHMHSVVERLLMNKDLPVPRSWLAVRGYWMGYLLVNTFMPNVQEVWGSEVPLYYPGKYAGTTDFVGVYNNEESILDFKQANKMKKRAWIEDYFIQLAAYACAHNVVHGTRINQGVILMVDQSGQTQEFVTCGREFELYKDAWMRKVDEFAKKEAQREEDSAGLSATTPEERVPGTFNGGNCESQS